MSLTYKSSGVDVKAGYESVKLMKKSVMKTFSKNVISDLGGFGGLFAIDKDKYEEPVLVSGTDGVGTKLKIAFMMDKHDTIGEDCVAMCANDILCQGAKPLFFLDYIATGKLKPTVVSDIVEGVANGCLKCGASLIGGETAEMPGFYSDGEYDVAGFCVGIVDKKNIINGFDIEAGDVIIGLPSSGLHSNGFSLVRKVLFDVNKTDINKRFDNLETTIGEEILKPTRIYYEPVFKLIEKFNIKGISHITGGGFYENIPRMLPENCMANINTRVIDTPPIFDIIRELGDIELDEMYRTFNMGVGMVMAVPSNEVEEIIDYLKEINEKVYLLGEVVNGKDGVKLCHK
ncbi:phosphoribosylformylglycinamidine cyclo-ligase [Abyssisolibacter fermentans]|uniref:phosphoribosylformylglycinamidine cyclo-ligase n=1 Tax=Abyssisolibacter fermentans TaxID=1766203 RepID=UPI0008333B77|nr:phosphoribosylformylglycinamidine cyclo-ligase [Abyssisolibacter fermentans]